MKLILFIAAVAGMYWLQDRLGLAERLDPETLRSVDRAWSPQWVGGYLLLWIVAGSLVMPTLAGGILFGWAGGTALGLTGALLASAVQLMVVRVLLRDPAEALFGDRIKPVQAMLEDRGPALLVAWRLLWMPHMVITVATALTRIPLWQHVAAVLAMLPGMLAVNLLSDSLLIYGVAGVPAERWAALAAVVVTSLAVWTWAQRRWPALALVRSSP